ncbi:MAG: molybdopterin-guanine dinucleotide biosynthesis protein B [Rhodospirillales bacterium]|nr:molybdopterin-guanine dinucleotide biosynthesis protein B [Rhodospirillales bacterium]
MKIFGLVGWSGSGKTTLIRKLIPELIGMGYRISTMKHTHHNFDIDKPGKDSHEHRVAGASQVLITGRNRWALLNENREQPEPTIEDLLMRMDDVDLVLIEGFKRHPHAKLEVFRPSVGKDMIARTDSSVIAVATDEKLDGIELPILDLNDVSAVARFVIEFCDLQKSEFNGAA